MHVATIASESVLCLVRLSLTVLRVRFTGQQLNVLASNFSSRVAVRYRPDVISSPLLVDFLHFRVVK